MHAAKIGSPCLVGLIHPMPRLKTLPTDATALDSLEVDVFFLHPTQLYRGDHWNAHLDNKRVNRLIDNTPCASKPAHSTWAGACMLPGTGKHILACSRGKTAPVGMPWNSPTKTFARRSFTTSKPGTTDAPSFLRAIGKAVGYLRWLLQEFFDGKPLAEQLVVAYGPGFDYYASDFKTLPFCEEADQTGCVCTWMSYGEGHFPNWLEANGQTPVCTHPVTWMLAGNNEAEGHQGVVLSQMRYAFPESIEAHIERGVLQIHEPEIPFGGALQRDNWHVGDINLFWLNIRENTKQRILSFR